MCDKLDVHVHAPILGEHDAVAAHLREHFEEAGVLAINLMGSPGSGKTAVLEATARALGGRWRLGAVSADLATDRDAPDAVSRPIGRRWRQDASASAARFCAGYAR